MTLSPGRTAMSKLSPLVHKLTLNGEFVEDFLAQKPLSFALGMLEYRKRRFAVLALRPLTSIPADIAVSGFKLGHSLLAEADCEVIHFAFDFAVFGAYDVLPNPQDPSVRAVVGSMLKQGLYFILTMGPADVVTVFREGFNQQDLVALKSNMRRIRRSSTTEMQYAQVLSQFRLRPDPPGSILDWVCRDKPAYLDPTQIPIELSSAPPDRLTTADAAELRELAGQLDARVKELERAGADDRELFLSMTDQLAIFKELLNEAGEDGMSVLYEEYSGLSRYAKLLAQVTLAIRTSAMKALH